MNAFESILSSMPEDLSGKLEELFSRYHFTASEKLEIAKEEADLRQWKEEPFVSIADYASIDSRKDGRKGEAYVKALRRHMLSLRRAETDYSAFFPKAPSPRHAKIVHDDGPLVLSRCPCPVDGEKTRCCKLRTLDTVTQCAFGCAYCSIQTFYDETGIHVVDNLAEKLAALPLDGVWHIGTGQASDSLLLGDDYGNLSALSDFAEAHPDIAIELKSKSGRDVFKRKYPKNLLFSWSLNAETIVEKEEHLTATLQARLENAERARDNGNLVGFHIHPMVLFKGWEEEYARVAEEITKRFAPEELYAVSIGTLTFTKSVLRRLREKGDESRVLEMELVPAAGKSSYPLPVKERMFSHVARSFPRSFRNGVFFYLCMEDPSLWLPVLGHEYASDREFELAMKEAYQLKINRLRLT